jgi:peptidoglycan/LPS O-acetylase OafA/YrhL
VRTVDQAFVARANSFNVLRLLFAASVILWHSASVGGFAIPKRLAFMGDIGVDCFFIVSGFLITRSWDRGRSAFRFLWHRLLRIYPGFWACLVVAIVAAAIAWSHDRGTLDGFFSAPDGPLSYLRANFHLGLDQHGISGTPAHVPYPGAWDIPLWTLRWEFGCYLGILVLGLVRLVSRSRPAILAALFAVAYGLVIAIHFDASHDNVNVLGGPLYDNVRFASTFLAGSAMYMYSDRIPAHRNIALGAAVIVGLALAFVPDYRIVALIPLTYLVIWMGATVRGPSITNKHDISYGVYIYGWIVQELLAIYGAYKLGFVPFAIFSFLGTVPFAVASWFAIERPSLRLKNWTPGRGRREDPAIPASAQGY